jgi:hypothetical protein
MRSDAHRSRLLAWDKVRRYAGGPVIALSALLSAWQGALAQPRSQGQNPDWPCRQILVGEVSLAAVWSGPAIEGIHWRDDRAAAALAAQLAARRTPIEDADRLVEDFAKAQGPDKAKRLIALFAGLFETLNDERRQVIAGLLRYGAKQRELAAKIRAESRSPREEAAKEPPGQAKQGTDAGASELEWDLRVFDERRQSIAYVCEAPTLIEQRLFALAKIIQRNLE